MLKKVVLLTVLLFCGQAFAADMQIKITPDREYNTVTKELKEGDFVDFVTTEDFGNIKKGTKVQGLLTERKENGFGDKVASLYIEQFNIGDKKLKGIVYQKGNEHPIYFEYFDIICALPVKILLLDTSVSYVRAGEAFLKPDKDIFTLYIEE